MDRLGRLDRSQKRYSKRSLDSQGPRYFKRFPDFAGTVEKIISKTDNGPKAQKGPKKDISKGPQISQGIFDVWLEMYLLDYLQAKSPKRSPDFTSIGIHKIYMRCIVF
jgi:hypothetical protein